MIYLDLVGRCGNQLFQYAFARLLMQERTEDALTINTYELNNNEGGNYWFNSLNQFNTVDYMEEESPVPSVLLYGNSVQKLLYKMKCLMDFFLRNKESHLYIWLDHVTFKLFSRFGLYYLRMGYSKHYKSAAKNIFIHGYFEDTRWPDKVYNLLKNELVPRDNTEKEDSVLNAFQEECELVCISVRRWELDINDVEELSNRNVCTQEYYKEAVKIIKDATSNPLFYVCSDDIEWAKSQMNAFLDGFKVIYETGSDSLAKKIFNMSRCKVFVLSNSTFCWWAQYLAADQKDLFVITPATWSGNKEDRHLVNERWVSIRTRNNYA